MYKSKLPWFLAGLGIMVLALFGSHAGKLGFVQRILSPQYVDAMRGLRQLEIQTNLKPNERGFPELSALFLERYREQNPERDMAGVEATLLDRQSAVISVEERNAPEVVPVSCQLSNGQTIEWNHAELMDAIERYRSSTAFLASLVLFAVGALIQIVAFMLERRGMRAMPVAVPQAAASE